MNTGVRRGTQKPGTCRTVQGSS